MIEESVKDRLIAYLEYKHLNKSQFGEIIGVSNAFVSSIRKSISVDKIQSIALKLPDLSIDWLLTGRGDMIRHSQSVGDIKNSSVSGVNVSGSDIQINPNAYDTLLSIVNTYQSSTLKFQDQMDRLITIIEKGGINDK